MFTFSYNLYLINILIYYHLFPSVYCEFSQTPLRQR